MNINIYQITISKAYNGDILLLQEDCGECQEIYISEKQAAIVAQGIIDLLEDKDNG